MQFDQLGLSADLLKAVKDLGYEKPTPIQQKAVPVILEGKDVMGAAQTGTGKTAGFTLPMLRRLEVYANKSMSPARHPLRGLILVPTRELAIQVFESVKEYSKYTSLKSSLVYGGVNIDSQIAVLRSGVEILVATPGRLLDHIQQKNVMLSNVEYFVLDEADRMLDMGFLPDIKKILNLLPAKRQNLMFSATFTDDIKRLAKQFLNDPVVIETSKRNSVSNLITHRVFSVDRNRKSDALIRLINEKKIDQAIIFTNTKSSSDQLAKKLLKHNLAAAAIHGDKNQLQRCQALNEFKQGDIRLLVATDVAARGLDIAELSCVINYELPNNPEDYVHRIGRTGRAGAKGYALSLVSSDEQKYLVEIEKLIQKKIKVETFDKENESGKTNRSKRRPPKEINQSKPSQSVEKKNTILKYPDIEVIYFNGEYSVRKNTLAAVKTDPLFTQPYISDQSEDTSTPIRLKLEKDALKSIPALFYPAFGKGTSAKKRKA